MDLVEPAKDAKPQSAPGDDVLAADHAGEPLDPLGDQFGVLDQHGGVADHAGDQHLALGQLHVLPHPPLVLVAGVGRLEGVGAGA